MASPEVWEVARGKILAAASSLNLPVAWPNEEFEAPPPYDLVSGAPNRWLAVEINGDLSEPIELTGAIWEETGTLHLHLMVPVGSGIVDGLGVRKQLANRFRNLPAAPVIWRGAILDPGGPISDDGAWAMLGLRLPYSYQDRTSSV